MNQKEAIVSVVKHDDKYFALEKVLEETGFFNILNASFNKSKINKKEFLIAIKPNIMFMYTRNDPSTFTDPELVEHLINLMFKEGFVNIAVVEAQSTYNNYYLKRGVKDAARQVGYTGKNYKVHDLTEEAVPYNFGGRLGEYKVGRTWKDANFRISFAKNKTHTYAWYTLTIKNTYGALYAQDKLREYHVGKTIYWPTIEQLKAFPVHFGLVDAFVSADGQFGIFASRYPRATKTVLGSENVLAVDAVGAEKMGLDPMISKYESEAAQAFSMPKIVRKGDSSLYYPWSNVFPILQKLVSMMQVSYFFSNYTFMTAVRVDPCFEPKPRPLFITILRMFLLPFNNLLMRPRKDVNSLKIAKFDPANVKRITKKCFIKLKRDEVYKKLVDNFAVIMPFEMLITKKITPGPTVEESRYTLIPHFFNRPMVNVIVTSIKKNEKLVVSFLEATPIAGNNSIVLMDKDSGTEVEITLEYRTRGILGWIYWNLTGGKNFYQCLVENFIEKLTG